MQYHILYNVNNNNLKVCCYISSIRRERLLLLSATSALRCLSANLRVVRPTFNTSRGSHGRGACVSLRMRIYLCANSLLRTLLGKVWGFFMPTDKLANLNNHVHEF